MRLFTHLRERMGTVPQRKAKRRPVTRFRPRLEALEDRSMLSTLTVLNTNDSGPGSLRAEIAAAKNGDTVVFAPTLNGQTINLTSGELLIKHNLTVAGPGASGLAVSGDNLSRVFEIAKGSLQDSISGLTISGGKSANGGGIEVDAGSTLAISDSTLSGNTASGSYGGGAIDNYGTLTISGSALSGNSAYVIGGGIHNEIGANLTISNSTVSNNTAPNLGGGINNDGTVTITSSTFSGNSGEGGGAIASDATLSITGSTLSNNTASDQGGAIQSSPGYKLAYQLTVSNCTLTDNSASYDGGAVWVAGSSGNLITGCTFGGASSYGNSAGERGGAIYVSGTLTLSGCTLSYNSADTLGLLPSSGGGLYVTQYGTVTVENGTSIVNNNAPAGGGPDVYNLGVVYVDSSSTIGSLNGNPAEPPPI